MKVCCVVGARPQFVKAAALLRVAADMKIEISLIHTGQHYDEKMSDVFFREMNIPLPKYNLNIGGLSQGSMTGRMIEQLEQVFEEECPDTVIVFGDTNSTLAAAITASKMHIPIAHIEAGLRSYNKQMPEEINRILTDHCSDILFTPTAASTANLVKEGIQLEKIKEVGDIMVDAFHYYINKAKKQNTILSRFNLTQKKYVLSTVHRSENIKDPLVLHSIFDALIKISKDNIIVLPLHPATKNALASANLLSKCEQFLQIVDPIGYLDMLLLQEGAKVVMTDSGGIQKEAYLSQTPCITLRNETEWTELVEHGYNILGGTESEKICKAFAVANNQIEIAWDAHVYGKGDASIKILNCIFNSY